MKEKPYVLPSDPLCNKAHEKQKKHWDYRFQRILDLRESRIKKGRNMPERISSAFTDEHRKGRIAVAAGIIKNNPGESMDHWIREMLMNYPMMPPYVAKYWLNCAIKKG